MDLNPNNQLMLNFEISALNTRLSLLEQDYINLDCEPRYILETERRIKALLDAGVDVEEFQSKLDDIKRQSSDTYFGKEGEA